jgi:hypothetical protein
MLEQYADKNALVYLAGGGIASPVVLPHQQHSIDNLLT